MYFRFYILYVFAYLCFPFFSQCIRFSQFVALLIKKTNLSRLEQRFSSWLSKDLGMVEIANHWNMVSDNLELIYKSQLIGTDNEI